MRAHSPRTAAPDSPASTAVPAEPSRRGPPRLVRRLILAVQICTIAILSAVIVSAAYAPQPGVAAPHTAPQSPTTIVPVAEEARLARLMRRHDCAVDGFGAEVIPGSALVQRQGQVRHVAFDEGWAVFTGEAPGRLLAVCRAAR